MKDAPEVSWHVKFDSQNLKHSGDLARWSTIAAHRPSPIAARAHESSIEPKHNLATLGINCVQNQVFELPFLSSGTVLCEVQTFYGKIRHPTL